MHAPANRPPRTTSDDTRIPLARRALALASCSAVLAMGLAISSGCDDTHAADRAISQKIAESRKAMTSGSDGQEASLKLLEEAASESNASPGSLAHVKALLAQAEMNQAQNLLQQLEEGQRTAIRLIHEIAGLGAQMELVNADVSAYRSAEPKAARAAATSQAAEAQGGPDKPVWFDHDAAKLPTLSAVKQEISRLEGEIAKQREQVQSLKEQRTNLLAQADKASQQAESLKGDASVKAFTQGSNLRKQAADLQTKIETTEAAIVPLERDLAVARGQQAAAQQAVTSYKALQDSMDKGWQDVQQQAQRAQALLAAIAGTGVEGATTGPSNTIAGKASELAAQLAQNRQWFDQAEQAINNASKHYEDATTSAEAFGREAQTASSGIDNKSRLAQSYQLAREALNPSYFKMEQASAKQALATLHASRVMVLTTLQRTAQALEQAYATAGLTLPESLQDPSIERDLRNSEQLAASNYEDAGKLYLDVAEAPQSDESRKNLSHVGRTFALYGQAQLARAQGNEQNAKQYLADARSARDLAMQNGASLPAMPPELVPPPPTSAPTTAPGMMQTPPGATPVEPAEPGATSAPEAPAPGTAAPEAPAPGAAAPAAPAPDAANPAPAP